MIKNIYKPTHKLFNSGNPIATGLLQIRGSNLAYLSRLENGKTIETVELRSIGIERLFSGDLAHIWRFYFGKDNAPDAIEKHERNLK